MVEYAQKEIIFKEYFLFECRFFWFLRVNQNHSKNNWYEFHSNKFIDDLLLTRSYIWAVDAILNLFCFKIFWKEDIWIASGDRLSKKEISLHFNSKSTINIQLKPQMTWEQETWHRFEYPSNIRLLSNTTNQSFALQSFLLKCTILTGKLMTY